MFSTIEAALDVLRAGKPVLVLDDEHRENEGDAILAAETATHEWMGWTIRHTSGYLCAPLESSRADALNLPPMVAVNEDPKRTAYTVAVDAAEGVTTGISAADRLRTAKVLADSNSGPQDLHRPGHLLPLRAREGGVLARPGHTEAAVDLCRLAGLTPVGIIGELVHDDGEMMRTKNVLDLGAEYGLPVITIADLITYRTEHERVKKVAQAELPTRYGKFISHAYRDLVTGVDHVALVSTKGLITSQGRSVVRIHSECLTGDAFGSLRCDCGTQLHVSMQSVAQNGGVIVYLRGHEGRGVGLANKIAAYQQQDQGLDTVDAQTVLGLPVDAREYGAAIAILRDLSVKNLDALTNNPDKIAALKHIDADLQVVEHNPGQTPENSHYLVTKRDRMGHHMHLKEQL